MRTSCDPDSPEQVVKLFNTIQIVSLFAAWPFLMSKIDDLFVGRIAHVASFIAFVAYVAGFVGMCVVTYDYIDGESNR